MKPFQKRKSTLILLIALLMVGQVASAATSTTTIGFTSSGSEVTLDRAPSFVFSQSNTAPVVDTTYTAQSVTNYLQVTDHRSLTLVSTWTVTAALGAFTADDGGATTLQGATLMLTGGISSQNTGLGVILPLATPIVTMVSGGSAVNVYTTVGVGSIGGGEFHDTWTASNVTLKVKGGTASEGGHTATINWTLATP